MPSGLNLGTRAVAVGVETGIVVLVAESVGGITYLLRAGSQSADKSVHGRDASSPKDETERRLRGGGAT